MNYVVDNPDSYFSGMRRGIIGFGTLGKRLKRLVTPDGEGVAIFDDTPGISAGYQQHPFCDYTSAEVADCWFVVGIGYKHLPSRRVVIKRLQEAGRRVHSITHATTLIDNRALVGAGSFLGIGASVGDGARIGDGTVLEAGATVCHDSCVGASSFLGPGVTVCGNATIGSCVFVGAGSVIRNGVSIGDNAVIGIGSVITRDIGEGEAWIGNPSQPSTRGIRL